MNAETKYLYVIWQVGKPTVTPFMIRASSVVSPFSSGLPPGPTV